MNKVIVAYVPVIHEGYRRFFESHATEARDLYIFGPEIIKHYRQIDKDINALPPEVTKKFIEALGFFKHVHILDEKNILDINGEALIMPDEDVSRTLAQKYLSKSGITWDSVLLRWDKHKTMEAKPVEADQKISREAFDKSVVSKLKKESEKSSDFWRRIGAAVVKNGEIILTAYNEHLPSAHSPHIHGDPRNNFHKGVALELSTAIHSEARLVAEAARKGIPLEGVSLYVTTFPCPPCAKQIAFSGIKKLFYTGGYVMLQQDKILKSRGVEIIFVEGN